MGWPRTAEMQAEITKLTDDRRMLWEERKRLLADREQLEALCEGLKRSLHGSSWVIASIDDRARQTIAGLDKEVAHLQVCLAYKDEVLEHERKEHLAQVKAAMEQLGQKNLLIENLQADLLELGEQKQQLTTDLDDLWIRVDEQMSWSEHCEQVIEGQAARLAARPPPAPWAPSGITAKPWSVHQNNKITQLFANKEELEKQMTCLQKQNDELKKESTQLKEALSESETLEFEVAMLSKRVAHLEVERLQRESEYDTVEASNKQLQGLVAELKIQLQEQQQITQVVADQQELIHQLASQQQANDQLRKEASQLKEALCESEALEVDVSLMSKHITHLEADRLKREVEYEKIVGDKEELGRQLTRLQQLNDELAKESQDALYEIELHEFEVQAMSQRLTHMEVERLQREPEHEEGMITNNRLQGIVADLETQLQELKCEPSNVNQHHPAAAVCDLAAAAQLALKPVAVSRSRISTTGDQAEEEPGTPDLTDLSCSYASSNLSSRRSSEVNATDSGSHDSAASSSIRSAAMEKVNALHPLYGCCSWV